MIQRKCLSFILAIAMLLAAIPFCVSAEGTANGKQDAREVYLHAQGENPSGGADVSNVPKGKVVDVFFAVDNPNKGAYITDETATPEQKDAIAAARQDAVNKVLADDSYKVKAESYAKKELTKAKKDIEKLSDESLEEEAKATIAEKYQLYLDEELNFNEAKYLEDKEKAYIDSMCDAMADREEELRRHANPENDMNGYTVKIYYDSAFFNLASDPGAPIIYDVPNQVANDEKTNVEVKPDDENDKAETVVVPDKGAYFFVTEHGLQDVEGSTFKAAYITVFFTGSYLPQEQVKKDAEGNVIDTWYNLCKLPLVPKKHGSSMVHIEVNSADPYTLELFAKDVPKEGFAPTFEFQPVNSGYHTINVGNMPTPKPPQPDKPAGTYVNGTEIQLSAEEDSIIWYSIDGGNYVKYWDPSWTTEKPTIKINQSTVITTYAERVTTDGSLKSIEAPYRYEIIPDSPSLYHDGENGKEKIIFEKYKGEPFYVYPRDGEVYTDEISENSEIYYTYSDTPFSSYEFAPGTNPEKEWVLLSKRNPQLLIDQNRTLRMVTYKMERYSEVAEYRLGIAPAPVQADPKSTYDCTDPFDVSLYTETPGAYIKYTTDGSNPVTNGVIYTEPITVSKDVQIKAVSVIGGTNEIYCDTVSTFSYMFVNYAEDRVEAFYPEGAYEESVYVTLTAQKPEYKIVYMREGIDDDFVDYSEPLFLDKNTKIIAKIIYPDGNYGKEYSFDYIIKPLPPEFAPLSTQFADSGTVIVSCMESNASTTKRYSLYYTTDGSDPTDPNNKGRILANTESDSAAIGIDGYTVISATVLRDGEEYSEVVVHSYDIVTSKPVKPVTTLVPGYYTREVDGQDFFTEFLPVPTGTNIYYTVDYEGGPCPAPMPDEKGTYLYVPGETKIDVQGKTIIRAVAVNEFNVRSDIATFTYTVVPEAPIAAPSASVYGDLPVVPVKSVPGSTVSYSVTAQNHPQDKYNVDFITPENGEFYIDTKTGNVYKDKECTEPLYAENPNHDEDNPFDSPVILNIKATLHDVTSETNTYRYEATPVDTTLAPPYADKQTGTYEEIELGDDSVLHVRLYSLNERDNAVIEYKLGNGDREWKNYSDLADGIVRMTGYTILEDGTKAYGYNVLQLRTRLDDGDGNPDNDAVSNMASYVYDFIPLPPVIEKPSGTYPQNPPLETVIYLDKDGVAPDAADHIDYEIYYRRNGDGGNDRLYLGDRLGIDHTMSFKAYTVNSKSGKKSKNVINYYIIESDSAGLVGIHSPYNVSRISAERLTLDEYADGIRLYPKKADVPADIVYSYAYKKVDEEKEITTPSYVYSDAMPILVNQTMDYIKISAYLQDKDGNMINDSLSDFYIDFVHLEAPITTLEKEYPGKIEYKRNTEYSVIHGRQNEGNIILYYTVDGSDPSDPENKNRIVFTGTEADQLKLTKATTVRAIYFSSCENEGCYECKRNNKADCQNGVYGKEGYYPYTIATTSNSGGGGGKVVIDNTRKYTIDVFGNEHPTHISYINGYPDGTVRPDGHITREEMATILYRVRNKAYDKPFSVTGDVFPDVDANRWSVNSIEYMASENVIIGYPDGEFKPSGNLTRAEFAALICRFADLKYTGKKDYSFPDVEKEHWAYKYITALLESGLVEGYVDGTFRPENQITRAEVVTVMNKLLGRKPLDSYVKKLDFNPYSDLKGDQWHYTAVMEATITHNYYLDKNGYEHKWEDWK